MPSFFSGALMFRPSFRNTLLLSFPLICAPLGNSWLARSRAEPGPQSTGLQHAPDALTGTARGPAPGAHSGSTG